MEGGKDELCGYVKQSEAMMTLSQGSLNWRYEDMQVTSSFPWQTVKESYTETTDITMPKVGNMSSISHDKVELKRTLTGLKFVKIASDGKLRVSP